jgi:hypothetical protein
MLDVAATAMLNALSKYLPPPAKSLPAPSVRVVKLAERPVGLGGTRSGDVTGSLGSIRRKGVRLDALTRFQLWATDATTADKAIGDLNMLVLADRQILWAAGFLRLALEDTPLSEPVAPPAGPWRGHADYRVLYEFDYQDQDGAASLISRIPVAIDHDLGESMTITDDMARWDNLAAAQLVARGPIAVGNLSMLAFMPKAAPTGAVTVARTFDGAAGNPVSHATLKEFLTAVSGVNPERNSMVTFPSFSDFVKAFRDTGGSIALGDWDGDGKIDQYKSLALSLSPAVALPTVRDRFEVTYQAPKFNQVAVVYLRATNG